MRNDVLLPDTAKLLAKIDAQILPPGTYLAGGTACALWLGHRQSQDLDFFSPLEFNVNQWKQKLEKSFDFKLYNQDWQTLEGIAQGVKMAIYYYKYPMIETPENYQALKIARLEDIVAMKMEAIVNRGTKRDFIDLYFLLNKFGLKEIFSYYDRKFGNLEERELLLRKSLVYFADAETDEMPNMLESVSWEQVKKYLEKVVLI